MKSKTKIFAISLLAIILLAEIAFVIWASFPAGPADGAIVALQSDTTIQVTEEDEWISFIPTDDAKPIGLIFYPGGRVDYRSYASLLRPIAMQGYPVYLLRVPLNLAVFSPNKAAKVIQSVPEVEQWVVGGHSLGGSMAALFADENPADVAGLVLWASYPTERNDLSDSDLAVTSIFASSDGLATIADIDASRPLLPADTVWVRIEGGNHAQFGDYGAQSGDLAASITAAVQWEQIVRATLELLARVGEG